jgi:hypothetical protein
VSSRGPGAEAPVDHRIRARREVDQLTFDTLPSAQGWTYGAAGNTAPETRVFSVSNNTLHQDSTGLGSASAGSNTYVLSGVVDPLPFRLTVRALLLQEEDFPPADENHFGFGFGGSTSTQAFGAGLGTDTQGRLVVQRGTLGQMNYQLLIDDVLTATVPFRADLTFNNQLFLGDVTGGYERAGR